MRGELRDHARGEPLVIGRVVLLAEQQQIGRRPGQIVLERQARRHLCAAGQPRQGARRAGPTRPAEHAGLTPTTADHAAHAIHARRAAHRCLAMTERNNSPMPTSRGPGTSSNASPAAMRPGTRTAR